MSVMIFLITLIASVTATAQTSASLQSSSQVIRCAITGESKTERLTFDRTLYSGVVGENTMFLLNAEADEAKLIANADLVSAIHPKNHGKILVGIIRSELDGAYTLSVSRLETSDPAKPAVVHEAFAVETASMVNVVLTVPPRHLMIVCVSAPM